MAWLYVAQQYNDWSYLASEHLKCVSSKVSCTLGMKYTLDFKDSVRENTESLNAFYVY